MEQAVARKGRGCEKQNSLLKDIQEAYDRFTLLQKLDTKGCGAKFLLAVRDSMQHSTGLKVKKPLKLTLEFARENAQVAPCSRSLYILYHRCYLFNGS